MVFDDAPDIPPDYAFDVNDVADEAFWQPPTGTTNQQNNQNDDLPFGNGTIQDFNNNDGISFNDTEFDNDNGNGNDNGNMTNRVQILKGEYAYKAFSNIRNFWAGPSYWKFSKNSNQSHQPSVGNATRAVRRKKKEPSKPVFDGDETSSDEYFIKIKSKAAKKLRHLNRALWNSDKLKLPPQCDVPSDLFAKYNKNQQPNTSTDSIEPNQDQNYDADDNDFGVSLMCMFCPFYSMSFTIHDLESCRLPLMIIIIHSLS